jgi:hypothetical protein
MTWDSDPRMWAESDSPKEPGPLVYVLVFLVFCMLAGIINTVGGMQPKPMSEDDYPSAYEDMSAGDWEQRHYEELERITHAPFGSLEERVSALERSR